MAYAPAAITRCPHMRVGRMQNADSIHALSGIKRFILDR
jgi:hypothetical protein